MRLNANEKAALIQIRDNLKSGKSYGKDIFRYGNGTRPTFPYFATAISYKPQPGRHPGYFCWTHAGSSANRATLEELKWLITVIFKMTPSEFCAEYITSDNSKIIPAYY